MKHLSIVVPGSDYNLASIIMTYEAFRRANEFYAQEGNEPVFTVQLVGSEDQLGIHNNIFLVRPEISFDKLEKTDLVIIAGQNIKPDQEIKKNQALIDWVRKQYKQGAEVGSICTGAYPLAMTGLLDGHECSIHWRVSNEFRKMFPKVILREDKIITEYNGIYTTGGALSSMNLVLRLIEKYYSRETAIRCAKHLQLDMNRSSQLPFTIFNGQKDHDDPVIKKAQRYIEENAGIRLAVETLADKYAIGRRHFERRFKKATGHTPLEYIQRVKIEAAKKKLEIGRENINEVMFSIGYSDVTAFRSLFRKMTGLTPTEYRVRYNKEALVA
jgi:transcriptional regulator GlxA family with amidase domain